MGHSVTAAVTPWIPGASALLNAGGNMYAANKQADIQRETNAQNYQIYQESKDFAREQADTQWEREKEMFNMENAYNDPTQVVQRLKNAGINPALAMQGSLGSAMSASANGGAATMANTPSAPSMVAPNVGEYFSNIATGVSDSMLKASQMLKNIADAKNVGINTDYLEMSLEYRLRADMADAQYKEMFADLYSEFEPQRLSKEMSRMDKENLKLDMEINNLIKQGKYTDAQRVLTELLQDKHIMENNYLSRYYSEKQNYVKRFVKAELDTAEETAKAIPKNAAAALTSASAAIMQGRAAELNAQTQKWIAENPSDAMSFIIKGLAENGLSAKEVMAKVKDILFGKRSWFPTFTPEQKKEVLRKTPAAQKLSWDYYLDRAD